MATHEMIVRRRALINQRIQTASAGLAEIYGIELAPPLPNRGNADHKANNEMERVAVNLERMLEAATKGNADGEGNEANGEIPDGQRSDRGNRRSDPRRRSTEAK